MAEFLILFGLYPFLKPAAASVTEKIKMGYPVSSGFLSLVPEQRRVCHWLCQCAQFGWSKETALAEPAAHGQDEVSAPLFAETT